MSQSFGQASAGADERFGAEPVGGAGSPPPKQRSALVGCLIAIAAAGLITLLVCGGGALYIYWNAKSFATNAATGVLKSAIEQSDMRPEDKKATIAEIERVAEGFKQGKISGDELGKILTEFGKSPLMAAMMLYGLQEQYLNQSQLSDEEKAAARLTFQRIARGVAEKKLKNEDLEPAVQLISEDVPNQGRRMKQKITDEELRAVLKKLDEIAAAKEVPEGEFQLDVAKELRRIVDEAAPGKLP